MALRRGNSPPSADVMRGVDHSSETVHHRMAASTGTDPHMLQVLFEGLSSKTSPPALSESRPKVGRASTNHDATVS
eukprot:scaffold302787_cov37-Tisochrysis_lutea.AAC.2